MSNQNDHENEDFAALLEESLAERPVGRRVHPGDRVRAAVVAISGDVVLLELGGKTEGLLDLVEVLDADGNPTVSPGDEVDAYVAHVGEEIRLTTQVRPGAGAEGLLEEAHASGIPVEGRVTGVNKGGLEVEVAGKRAFCPVSQVEIGHVDDPTLYVGQRLTFRITRLERNNIVLSRRALLEAERAERAEKTWATLEPGQVLEGEVVRVLEFGAFVDVGGVEGLIHVSELSHERIARPADLLHKGQKVRVQVLTIDRDSGRVGLSLKALEADPWDDAVERFPVGSSHPGRVVRLQPFGAFVHLGGGLEGLAHVSELSDRRIGHPREVLAEGDEVRVRILEVDPERHRISLSLKEAAESTGEPPSVGSTVTAVVDRVEAYGLLVRFGGHRGLIPERELPERGGASPRPLRQAYPVGTELVARVIEIDPERGRIRLSVTQAGEEEARADFEAYQGAGRTQGGLGTLGDLLKAKLKK